MLGFLASAAGYSPIVRARPLMLPEAAAFYTSVVHGEQLTPAQRLLLERRSLNEMKERLTPNPTPLPYPLPLTPNPDPNPHPHLFTLTLTLKQTLTRTRTRSASVWPGGTHRRSSTGGCPRACSWRERARRGPSWAALALSWRSWTSRSASCCAGRGARRFCANGWVMVALRPAAAAGASHRPLAAASTGHSCQASWTRRPPRCEHRSAPTTTALTTALNHRPRHPPLRCHCPRHHHRPRPHHHRSRHRAPA